MMPPLEFEESFEVTLSHEDCAPPSLSEGEEPVSSPGEAGGSSETCQQLRDSGDSEEGAESANRKCSPRTDQHSASSSLLVPSLVHNGKKESSEAGDMPSAFFSNASVGHDDGRQEADTKKDESGEERRNLSPVEGLSLSDRVNETRSGGHQEYLELTQHLQRSGTEKSESKEMAEDRSRGALSTIASNPLQRRSSSSLPADLSASASYFAETVSTAEETHADFTSPSPKAAGMFAHNFKVSPRVNQGPVVGMSAAASPENRSASHSETTPRVIRDKRTLHDVKKVASKSSASSPGVVKTGKLTNGGGEEKSSSSPRLQKQKASSKSTDAGRLPSSSQPLRTAAAKSGNSGDTQSGETTRAAALKSAGSTPLTVNPGSKTNLGETGETPRSSRGNARGEGDSSESRGGPEVGATEGPVRGGEFPSQKTTTKNASSEKQGKHNALQKWQSFSSSVTPRSYPNSTGAAILEDRGPMFRSAFSNAIASPSARNSDERRSSPSGEKCFFRPLERAESAPSVVASKPCTAMEAAKLAWHQQKMASMSGFSSLSPCRQSSCHSMADAHACRRVWNTKGSGSGAPGGKARGAAAAVRGRGGVSLQFLRTMGTKAAPPGGTTGQAPASGSGQPAGVEGGFASQFKTLVRNLSAGFRGVSGTDQSDSLECFTDASGDDVPQRNPSPPRPVASSASSVAGGSAAPGRAASGKVSAPPGPWTPFTQLFVVKMLKQRQRVKGQDVAPQDARGESAVLHASSNNSLASLQSCRSGALTQNLASRLASGSQSRWEENDEARRSHIISWDSRSPLTAGRIPSRAPNSPPANPALDVDPRRCTPSLYPAQLPLTPLEQAFLSPFEQKWGQPHSALISRSTPRISSYAIGGLSPHMFSFVKLPTSSMYRQDTHASAIHRLRAEVNPLRLLRGDTQTPPRFSGVSPLLETVMGEVEREYETRLAAARSRSRSRSSVRAGSGSTTVEASGPWASSDDTYGLYGETRLMERKTQRTTDLDDIRRADVSQRFLLTCLLFLRSNNDSVTIWQELDECRRELRALLATRRQLERADVRWGRRQRSSDSDKSGARSSSQRSETQGETHGLSPGDRGQASDNEALQTPGNDDSREKQGWAAKKEGQGGGSEKRNADSGEVDVGSCGAVKIPAVTASEGQGKEAEGECEGEKLTAVRIPGENEVDKKPPTHRRAESDASETSDGDSEHRIDGLSDTHEDDSEARFPYATSIEDMSPFGACEESNAFRKSKKGHAKRGRRLRDLAHTRSFRPGNKASGSEYGSWDHEFNATEAAAEAILRRLRVISERSKTCPTLRTQQISEQCWTEGSLFPLLPLLLNSCRNAVPPTVAVPVVAAAYVLILSSLLVARLQCCQAVAECCLLVRHFIDPLALTYRRNWMDAVRSLESDRARLEYLREKEALQIVRDSRHAFVAILAAVYPFDFLVSPEVLLRLQQSELLNGEEEKKKGRTTTPEAGASQNHPDLPLACRTRRERRRASGARDRGLTRQGPDLETTSPLSETNLERLKDERLKELQVQIDRLNRRIDWLAERQEEIREAVDEMLAEMVELDHIEGEVMEEVANARAKSPKRQDETQGLGLRDGGSWKRKEKESPSESLAQIEARRSEVEEQVLQLNDMSKRVGKELSRVQHQREDLLVAVKRRQEELQKKLKARQKAQEQLRKDENAHKKGKDVPQVSSATPASGMKTPDAQPRGAFSGTSSTPSRAPAHRGGISWRAEGEVRCLVEMTELVLKTIQLQGCGDDRDDESTTGRPRFLDDAEVAFVDRLQNDRDFGAFFVGDPVEAKSLKERDYGRYSTPLGKMSGKSLDRPESVYSENAIAQSTGDAAERDTGKWRPDKLCDDVAAQGFLQATQRTFPFNPWDVPNPQVVRELFKLIDDPLITVRLTSSKVASIAMVASLQPTGVAAWNLLDQLLGGPQQSCCDSDGSS
ncbi:putative ppg3 [Toxoplasma gondii GAB2-2007-GAL-DOM2]|uniref:Ppg3, putative n=3 Tax=Toxoplasma gondii TaxID=5811 RepID=V4YPC7_TOXGV|nr:putative ppg3 [Toxoplasma gondii VEG]KFG36392.1 putative ppg3 [Toxoplasma gondii p89]KFG41466.1 putative ppg3 [Toxoplasma gondii GAB2-2007-GAL-DOM2]CEL71901.1 TPA: ppg3, putative [Toxoplasma gondii VEG]